MVKHTQTIRWLLPTNCLSVSDHFVAFALKVLTIVEVKETICSFTLILEWKPRREIPGSSRLRDLKKGFCKQLCLYIRCRRQNQMIIKLKRNSRLTFVENSANNSLKLARANDQEVIDLLKGTLMQI